MISPPRCKCSIIQSFGGAIEKGETAAIPRGFHRGSDNVGSGIDGGASEAVGFSIFYDCGSDGGAARRLL
jgi:hypothetical protein